MTCPWCGETFPDELQRDIHAAYCDRAPQKGH